MPIKVMDSQGDIPDSAIILGLQWATDHGATVINLSLGGECNSAAFADAFELAQTSGALVVASAGNSFLPADGNNPVIFPAAETGVLGVGATGRNGLHAPYSETGDFVDLVAPGGTGDTGANNIPLLAPGGGTTTNAGTSFSSPTVAAAAALVLAKNPLLSPSRRASSSNALRTTSERPATTRPTAPASSTREPRSTPRSPLRRARAPMCRSTPNASSTHATRASGTSARRSATTARSRCRWPERAPCRRRASSRR